MLMRQTRLLVYIPTDHQDLLVGHWPLSTHLINHNLVLVALGSIPHSSKGSDNLTMLSAHVRGFQTNISDLTHRHVIPHKPNLIATVETFLNPTVSEDFGQISGLSKWHRKKNSGTFGSVTYCFCKALYVQPLEIDIPDHLELMFYKGSG